MRLQAAQLFAQDVDAGQIAGLLRVSTKSVYQWWRAWPGRLRVGLALARVAALIMRLFSVPYTLRGAPVIAVPARVHPSRAGQRIELV